MPPPANPPWVKDPRDDDLHSMLQGSAGIIDGDEKWGHPPRACPQGWGGEPRGHREALQAAGSNSLSEPPAPSSLSSASLVSSTSVAHMFLEAWAMAWSHWSLPLCPTPPGVQEAA